MNKPEVQAYLKKFVRIKLYTDRKTDDNVRNRKILNEVYKYNGLPLYVFLTPDGKEVARLPKSVTDTLPSVQDFVQAFRQAEEKTLSLSGNGK